MDNKNNLKIAQAENSPGSALINSEFSKGSDD